MQLGMTTVSVISITSIGIAFFSLIFSLMRASAAMKQARVASESLHRMTIRCLFSTFNQASQICVDDPNVFYAVDGLDRSIPPDEAKNIAYFGLLMDGFQQFYGHLYNDDFNKMLKALKEKSTYLNNLLSVKENQARWQHIRQLYYGSFDQTFVNAIDELIQHVNRQKR